MLWLLTRAESGRAEVNRDNMCQPGPGDGVRSYHLGLGEKRRDGGDLRQDRRYRDTQKGARAGRWRTSVSICVCVKMIRFAKQEQWGAITPIKGSASLSPGANRLFLSLSPAL